MILVLRIRGNFILYYVFEKYIGISFLDLSPEAVHSFKMTLCIKGCFTWSEKWWFSSIAVMEIELQDELSESFSKQWISIYLLRVLYARNSVSFRIMSKTDYVAMFMGSFPGDLEIAEALFWKSKWSISVILFAVIARDGDKWFGARSRNIKLGYFMWSGI